MNEKINEGLASLVVPIGGLYVDPANSRAHSERNIDAIKASLAEFGQQKPIVCLSSGKVIAGNGTLDAAKALGWERIAIVKFDSESDAKAVAYSIADNRTAELAEWNSYNLESQIKLLKENDFDLSKLYIDDLKFDFFDTEIVDVLISSNLPCNRSKKFLWPE